ncbi:MAG TPA: hypothetical protein VHC63_13435 [Acidimicrobiales bacterium]|nr:hypothetical protein [Acidimicrobiales bacterium]
MAERNGLRDAMRAVCKAAGWEYCAEHNEPLLYAPKGCLGRHPKPEPQHVYWCEYPERGCICPPGAGVNEGAK